MRLFAALCLFLLTTCGSHNGSVIISGTTALGPLRSATVRIYSLKADGSKAIEIASTTTDSSGNYSLNFDPVDQPAMLEVTGGDFKNEANGETITLTESESYSTLLKNVTASQKVAVTPVTDIASTLLTQTAGTGGSLVDRIDAVYSDLTEAAGFDTGKDIRNILPVDYTSREQVEAATSDQRKHTLFLAALSQQLADQGSTTLTQKHLIQAYADDFEDREFNGEKQDGSRVSISGDTARPLNESAWTAGISAAAAQWKEANPTLGFTASDELKPIDKPTGNNSEPGFSLAVSVSGSTATLTWSTPGKASVFNISVLKLQGGAAATEVASFSSLSGTSKDLIGLSAGDYYAMIEVYQSGTAIKKTGLSFSIASNGTSGGPTDLQITNVYFQAPYVYVSYKNAGAGTSSDTFLIKLCTTTRCYYGNSFYPFSVPAAGGTGTTGGYTPGLFDLFAGTTKDVTVTIDWENHVSETDEGNNTVIYTITNP